MMGRALSDIPPECPFNPVLSPEKLDAGPWAVVFCHTNREKALAHCLLRNETELSYYLPLAQQQDSNRNITVRALFPGYIFVQGIYRTAQQISRPRSYGDKQLGRITLQDFQEIRWACKESGYMLDFLLACNDDLLPIIRLLMSEPPNSRTLLTGQVMPKVGRRVQVAEGPLRGLQGTVEDIHQSSLLQGRTKIYVQVPLLGQVISAEFDALDNQLEAV